MELANQINTIVSNKNNYLNLEEYEQIIKLINANKSDLFFIETEVILQLNPVLDAYLNDAEMYYGFTNNEVLRFIEGLEEIGYTCNYVDLATRDNGELSHTVKPYNLRKINPNN